MIHKVLDAYFAVKKQKKIKGDIVLSIFIVTLYVAAIIIPLFFECKNIIKLVIQIVASVLFLAFVVYSEDKKCQKWKTEFNEYNKTLDEISKILKALEYQNAFGCGNWYSKEKIDYLIASSEKWISEQNESKAKHEKLAHIVVLPVVGFIAAVIQENVSVEDAVSIGVVVIVVVGMWYIIDRGVSMLIDSVIKTASIDEMTMLMNLLQDLRARDFT